MKTQSPKKGFGARILKRKLINDKKQVLLEALVRAQESGGPVFIYSPLSSLDVLRTAIAEIRKSQDLKGVVISDPNRWETFTVIRIFKPMEEEELEGAA